MFVLFCLCPVNFNFRPRTHFPPDIISHRSEWTIIITTRLWDVHLHWSVLNIDAIPYIIEILKSDGNRWKKNLRISKNNQIHLHTNVARKLLIYLCIRRSFDCNGFSKMYEHRFRSLCACFFFFFLLVARYAIFFTMQKNLWILILLAKGFVT